MSTVRDSEGNVLNQHPAQFRDGNGNVKYSGKDMDTLDWFDTHPEDRPTLEEVVVEDGQPVAIVPNVAANEMIAKLVEATADPAIQPSAADLDAVAAEQDAAQATSGEQIGNQDGSSSDNGVQSE